MEFKTLIFTIVVVVSVKSALSFPRDASVNKEEVFQINEEDKVIEKQQTVAVDTSYSMVDTVDTEVTTVTTDSSTAIYSRIPCPYEEATEADVCQEHCLPKGYSYGLCISRTCSCV